MKKESSSAGTEGQADELKQQGEDRSLVAFSESLPQWRTEYATKSRSDIRSRPVRGQILLVEDSKFLRVAIDRVLTRAGYTINTASDGEEGVRAAQELLPDLVVLDMTLPKLSGTEVLHALKKDPGTSDIPVIVLTAPSERNRKKLLDEGAAACLEKSDTLLEKDSAALIETVVHVLDKTAASKPETRRSRH